MTEVSTMLLQVISESNVQEKIHPLLREAERILVFIFENCPGQFKISNKKLNYFNSL